MTSPDLTLPFRIRAMRTEDLEKVQVIDRTSFSLPWPTSAYNYELNNPMSLSWVAEIFMEEGQPTIVGMVVVWLIVDEAHIATLAVEPGYRRLGIGQALLVTALEEAIQRGMLEVTLEVRANNIPARRLYQRFKFEIAGYRPRYYRDNNEDALIMTMNHLGEPYLAWLENGAWKQSKDATISESSKTTASEP